VRHLVFVVAPGSLTCLLGRNGTGKTLALRTLAGLRPISRGAVTIKGRTLGSIERRELARNRALLSQSSEDPFPSTVLEAVLVGRHPHLGAWQWEAARDREIAREHLSEVELTDFEHRDLATLSGGERRRVAIAAVLAQSPDVYLLDEPTNHLDPHHQLAVMSLFRARADAGRAVLMSLHEPGLAVRYADAALLLYGDGDWSFGPAAEMLTEANLSRLYRMPVRELRWDCGRTFVPR
jgi:iron complex transport system ATP-binding protein